MIRYIALALILSSTTAFGMDVHDKSDHKTDIQNLIKPNVYTLVMIWSLDCYYCELDKPIASAFHDRHKDLRANVILVANDGPSHRNAITEKHDNSNIKLANYTVTSNFYDDYKALTGDDYLATPTYLLYGPDKQVQGIHVGPLDFNSLESIVSKGKVVAPSADLMR